MDADHARGLMLGLACGDALGRPVEFKSASEISAEYDGLDTMVGQGTWNQPAGTITDDTEQALCIARSLDEQQSFDPADIADRFVAWYESGPFDIGVMTAQSLRALQRGASWDTAGHEIWEQSPEGSNAGNGSVMRCPPLSIPFVDEPATLAAVSQQSSQITHADPRCTYGCAVLNLTLAGILREINDPLTSALTHVDTEAPEELVTALTPIAEGESCGELQTSGYVIHSLQTALQDALSAETAEEAIVTAVNRGGDTDTIGAITGAIAGARFGAASLPDRWIDSIDETAELEALEDQLSELA